MRSGTTQPRSDSTGTAPETVDAVRALADFVACTGFDDLPKEVVERAKRTIADTVGVAVRGSIAPEITALSERLTAGQSGRSVVLRPGFPRSSAGATAFLNATASCFLELDEGSRPTGHPAIHVLPSALALAQELGASGRELITAFVLGYEVQGRTQRAAQLRTPVHCHGTLGGPAAAAVVGKLVGWDTDTMVRAMNAAATLATCTTYSLCYAGATMRNVAAAMSAQHAFTVRDLVESGFTAYEDAIAEVFGQVLGDDFDAHELTAKLGEQYAILGNYAKFHATCGGAHPALDALADALGTRLGPESFPWRVQHDVKLDDVVAIDVRTSHRDAKLGRVARRNSLSAKFSIPFALGAFFVRGAADPAAFEGDGLEDERIWRIADTVHVHPDEALDAEWPDYYAIADVRISLADGRELTGTCGNPYGSPDNQADWQDVQAKFDWLLDGVIPDSQATALLANTLELDRVDDVSLYGVQ